MNQLEYRHEFKHCINLPDYYSLRQCIKAVARADPNAGSDGSYHIRSLYFDNDDDKALREKLNGLPKREKFRIRLYNGKSDIIRLEKKSKDNKLSNKRSAALSQEQTERILSGDTGWMRDSGDALILELYSKMIYQRLRPRTIVDYRREAYIFPYGNVRITFDTDLRSGLYSKSLFDKNLPALRIGDPGVLIMEVKYDNYLPDVILDAIQIKNRRSEAFSKYAACRVYG